MCFGTKKKVPSEKNDESQRVSPSLYFETRKLVFLGLIGGYVGNKLTNKKSGQKIGSIVGRIAGSYVPF